MNKQPFILIILTLLITQSEIFATYQNQQRALSCKQLQDTHFFIQQFGIEIYPKIPHCFNKIALIPHTTPITTEKSLCEIVRINANHLHLVGRNNIFFIVYYGDQSKIITPQDANYTTNLQTLLQGADRIIAIASTTHTQSHRQCSVQ